MPGNATRVGTGLSVTFGTSAYTTELLSASWSGASRESIDVRHMLSAKDAGDDFGVQSAGGAASFIPAEYADGGSFTCTAHFNPGDDLLMGPINAGAKTITFE